MTFLSNETHDLWLNEPSEDPLNLNPGTHPSTKINYNIQIKDLHVQIRFDFTPNELISCVWPLVADLKQAFGLELAVLMVVQLNARKFRKL